MSSLLLHIGEVFDNLKFRRIHSGIHWGCKMKNLVNYLGKSVNLKIINDVSIC